jgi:glycosyltransferase involved in cell wall biosynthesis
MRTLAHFLAGAAGPPRFSVRALATTASEAGEFEGGAAAYLRGAGFTVSTERLDAGGEQRALRFADGPVAYTLLDRPGHPWDVVPSSRPFFSLLLEESLAWSPDLVFTYGGTEDEIAWRQRARAGGARVIFCLHNLRYLEVDYAFFGPEGGIDATVCVSEHQATRYRQALGLESTVLAMPVGLEDVLAPEPCERVFATYINPSVEKGLHFAVRLLDELAQRRPDLPLLVVESRAGADLLLATADTVGIDLRRHENLMVTPAVAHPREIYAVSRMILMPSVCEEAAGRVVAEALINGVPCIVSDRGGLPETCGEGGIVLPVPEYMTLVSKQIAAAEEVQEWVAAIERLFDDEAEYAAMCERARRSARRFLPETLAPAYREFFAAVPARSEAERGR